MRVSMKELNDFSHGTISAIAWRPYGVADGLPIGQCSAGSQPAVCAGQDGTMWFSTIKGLAFVRPAQIHRNTNQPPILIEMLKVQGKPQLTNTLTATTPIAVTLPARQEGLEIDYTSLNLAAPERALFKYRLQVEGSPAHWFGPASVRVAQYPKLPPGRYRFEV